MNKNTKIITTVIVLIVLAAIYFSIKSNEPSLQNDTSQNGEITTQINSVSNGEENTVTKSGSYEAYSPEKIARASVDHDVVLFFRASWCPTCRAVDSDIKANLNEIPASLTILDIDYDKSSELKQKYGVTYQHTFVQVDKDGNLIKKWSGSPTLSSLVTEVS
ncbi:thioredoxin family protein [Candidatus Nomurabacteria bacterium]|nr:thioredoxin family protein [Candidatus Nomurabacteria bacterium]